MTPQLLAFLQERASLAELPDTLELPAALWQHMNQLWQRSVSEIEEGIVQEWGGLLVLDEQVGLKLVNIVSGEALQLRLQNLLSYEDAFWYTLIDLCRELGVALYEGVASKALGEVYRP